MHTLLETTSTSHLLAQTCKAYRKAVHKALAELGLHPGQDMILQQLWCEDGLTQTEIAEQHCVQAATITKMLQRMVNAGLVERRKDPDDQRVLRVYLTTRGRALQEPIEQLWNRMEKKLFVNMSLDEKILLRRLLLQVYNNLNPEA